MKTTIQSLKIPALFVLMGMLLTFTACNKAARSKWDDQLNGSWVEVDPETGSDLTYPTELNFSENYMNMDGYAISATFSEDGKVYTDDNQIFGTWKILVRRHIEYLYDYEIISGQLWLVTDASEGKASNIKDLSTARRFRKK